MNSLPVTLTLRQVWEQAERVGADLVARRDAEILRLHLGSFPRGPENVPDVLILSPDGGRLQNRALPAGERWCEYKALVAYRLTRDPGLHDGARPDPQPHVHWRYYALHADPVKIGAAHPKVFEDPEPEVPTYTATTRPVDDFIPLVEAEARRRGLLEARVLVVIGDGGDFVWRTAAEIGALRRARGQEVYEILDLIHASNHLRDAARALHAAGLEPQPVRWLNARIQELWAGEAQTLIEALEAAALRAGPRPPRRVRQAAPPTSPEDEETVAEDVPPLTVLWRCRDYFEEHRLRIRYDVFRRLGLPLHSTHIESGIKQTNRRMKGTEKAWLKEHAEEMLALRCQKLSDDGRWDEYWNQVRSGVIEIPTPGRRKAAPLPDLSVSKPPSASPRRTVPPSPAPHRVSPPTLPVAAAGV